MKQELYARIVMPERASEDNRFVFQSMRHGQTRVELVDERGNLVAHLKGIQGVSITASDDAFMDVSLQLVADVEFPK